jgi:thiol-disulfide isomerase/thioredoxin
MNKLSPIAWVILLLFASLASAEPPRDAEFIWKEYHTVKMPTLDRTKIGDQAYLRTFSDELNKAKAKRNALALEFYRGYPKDERAAELLLARWKSMSGWETEKADAEIEEFLKDQPNSKVKGEVHYSRAMMAATMASIQPPRSASGREVEDFIRSFPGDERGAHLLMTLARGRFKTKDEQLSIYRRITDQYAGTRTAKVARGSMRRIDAIGKPFELEFKDAMTGQQVSMPELRGKVVVVDFWATWCGPCVAEMPALKELYAKYNDQEVEFIGVSLDQPGEGLDKLKAFVAENQIPWRQYYQGDGWDSEFSQSWGINSIPALFVVDAEGNLHSTEARSKLDSVIAELIKRRDG